MAVIRRILRYPDGREEVFLPHRDEQGRFVLAIQQTDDPINYASNQVYVVSEAALVEKVRTRQYHLRMSTGSGPANLISPESIELIE
jgi:hypothetical protein